MAHTRVCMANSTFSGPMMLGADVTVLGTNGRAPLLEACRLGYVKPAKPLLRRGLNVNLVDNGLSLFYPAAFKGYTIIAKHLVLKGTEVTERNDYGWSSLAASAMNRHRKTASLFTNRGVGADEPGGSGKTALYVAYQADPLISAFVLLERAATVVKSIYEECYSGHFGMGEHLIKEAGADLTFIGNSWWSLLLAAGLNGHLDVAELLVGKSITVDGHENDGLIPLYARFEMGYVELVKLLLERGADTRIADDSGTTPVKAAAGQGHTEIVELLNAGDAWNSMEDTNGIKCAQG